jgi:anti-anti-sigma regulatory factor
MCQMRTRVDGIADHHCAVQMRGTKVFLRDLGSGLSTVLNGDTVPHGEEWPLRAGDRIEVGPLEFLIEFTEKALSQRDLEEWALKCLDQSSDRRRSALEEIDDVFAQAKRHHDTAASAAGSVLDQLSAMRGLVKGHLRVGREGGVTHVRINDQYLVEESELSFIKKELYDNLDAPNLRVLLDLKNVRRMSSMAAEIISEFARHVRRTGGQMAMCRMRPELRGTLQEMPSLRGIPSFADKESAMKAKW